MCTVQLPLPNKYTFCRILEFEHFKIDMLHLMRIERFTKKLNVQCMSNRVCISFRSGSKVLNSRQATLQPAAIFRGRMARHTP